MPRQPARIHLLDPTFDRIDRTYCGMAGPALTSPTTTDPAEATCKLCLRYRRNLDRHRAAQEIARQVKP
jgi:hypothetical protein